MVHISIRTEQS